MARLIYSAIASVDGYVEDGDGRFEWGAPDEEVLRFLNDREGSVGTYLYGRRMYETMTYWETAPVDERASEPERVFAQLWSSAEKVVFSRTLAAPRTPRTRLVRTFDPEVVRHMKASLDRDLTIGGADLAGQAVAAGLVDELELYVAPVVVGGGKPWLATRARLGLELRESRAFAGGFAFLRYRPS